MANPAPQPRRPARFTAADVRRAIAGAQKAGLVVAGVHILPDGSIRVLSTAAPDMQPSEPEPNEWD
jgi:hypothetical protein